MADDDIADPDAAGPPSSLSGEEGDIMQFPMPFPVKVMGLAVDGFADAIILIVRNHAPDFDPATTEMRSSKGGKYLSLTATINATSRAQLDELYRALTAHPMVKIAL